VNRRSWRIAGVLGTQLVVLLCLGGSASAQLVLHPEPSLERFAGHVARAYERHTGDEAIVGDPPPSMPHADDAWLPEAVPEGHVALVRTEVGVALALGASEGRTVDTLVRGELTRREATSVALAIDSLALEAARLPPVEEEPVPESWFTVRHYDLTPPPRPQVAAPTVYFRLLAGYSPTRGTPLVGPGAGLGFCVGAQCFVIEADLPLFADELRTARGELVRYRAVNASARLQLRPLVRGRHALGVTLGFLTRIGNASVVGTDVREQATNLGARMTVEYAVRVAGPLEVVFEGGLDAVGRRSRARLLHDGQRMYLEDTYTPWAVMGLRLRPDLRGGE